MGNVLKRNHSKTSRTSAFMHSLSYALYKRNESSKRDGANGVDWDENNDETTSWTTTIGTRSAFSVSYPTGETSENEINEESSRSQSECILPSNDYYERSLMTSDSVSNTSADFSSFKNLSEISEHTTVHPRPADIKWMNDVQQYHQQEPVFRKKPFRAALKIRSRRVFPELKWTHLYHQWALRQSPKAYKGKDVLNPYISRALKKKTDIDLHSSDLERGIFYLKCTSC
uniref:Uncharacterized protein n=1 Tax=Elaeophora elaphi TaxID=1147741 RepID=A0A158Q8C3_9BILA